MEKNVDEKRVGRTTGSSWAKSIFKFIDRLITHDSSPRDRVFVIGFGSSCRQDIFDVLTTLKTLQSVGETNRRSKRDMLDEAVKVLKYYGAPRVLTWATIDEIDAQINESQTSLMLHALKNKPEFRHKFIYDCLPASCRGVQLGVVSFAKEIANCTIGYIPDVHRYMTEDSVIDVIKKGTDLARDYVLEPVSRDAVYSVKDASKNVRGSIGDEEFTEQRTNELFERVKPYIYGNTPLIESLGQAVTLFSGNRNHQYKLLFVLSDGKPTDGHYPPLRKLADLDVKVVSCYIASSPITDPRRLYSSELPEWDEAAKFMFSMSSSIPTEKIPRSVFVKKGWTIDIENNETRMFFQINHPDIIDEVCDFAKNCVCSQDALADVLSSVSLDIYINKANKGFSPKQQEGNTCYAVASAIVMHLAMMRIVGREGGCPDFYEIRDELIKKYGVQKGNVFEVLCDFCPKYRLQCKNTDERGAMAAVVEKRPVVAIFQLSRDEWSSFYSFYERNPRGILTRNDLNISTSQQGVGRIGHAVVLTSFDSESLRLMNSRGRKIGQKTSDWADGGFFMIRNAAVLGLKFYDVFWTEEDLLPSEKEAYSRDGADISTKLMKSLTSLQTATYKCPVCLVASNVSEFRGHLLKAQCPRCKMLMLMLLEAIWRLTSI